MNTIRLAHYGQNGHSLFGRLPQLSGAELTAVSGMPEARFEDLKRKLAGRMARATYYPDFDSMLAEGECDLVVFCSPRRAEQNTQIEQALLAGKHVLAEKPIVTSREALGRVRAAQAKSGRHVRAMLNQVYTPVIRRMRTLVESGKLGEVVQVYALKSYPYHDGRPQDRGVDGGIGQAAIHAVSVIRKATGLDFVEVFAQDTKRGNPNPGELQMGMNLACRLSNGGLASIMANYCNPRSFGLHGNDQIRIFGTRGMVEAVDGFKRVSIADEEGPLRAWELPDMPNAYPQDIIDFLRGGEPPVVTLEDSLHSTEVVLAAQESADSGSAIRLNPASSA
ncbi:MAG: Gfo/Idh/MocA family oxidoreductase [Kiritimatiellae bacterium]|nr:Gfo/Idh/MocA family oxidoreductase [Kiritimatiellia bacterium]